MQDLLEDLNAAQRAAVTHESGPLLIVAGAGTGKTTVLTRRYTHLLQSGQCTVGSEQHIQNFPSPLPTAHCTLSTDNLLALTFTEKAAGEMEDRVLRLLPNGTYDFWISTFHGFCRRLLERYAFEIGLPNRFRLLNETDAWLVLKRHLHELPLHHYRPLGNPVKFLAGLLKHFSRAKDEGVTPEQYLAFAETIALDGDAEFVTGERARLKEIADCYFAYRRILREEGALDFGDLIMETLRLLRERPAVLKELREQFAHVLVDEFQDTNWAQYELIKLIVGERKQLTVVGDDDQAIYKFRGASLANILQFRDDFPDAVTIALTENYRSRQEILDVAYTFITHNNPNRLEVQLADTGLEKRLESRSGNGGAVNVLWFKTVEDEAEGIVTRMYEMKNADATLTWNDFAILSRSNDGCEPFVLALERHDIPFRFVAMRGVYAKPVVVDITAMFSLLLTPHDSAAVWRALNAPCYAFTARDLAEFLQFAARKKRGTLWEALTACREIPGIGDETVARTETFVSHIQHLSEALRRERPLTALQRTLEKTGYLTTILKWPEREKIEALNDLNAFAHRITQYEHTTPAPILKGFMEEFRLEVESGEEGAHVEAMDLGPDLVSVMTVHASKGLEFTHVFLVALVDQRFPTRARGDAIPLPDGLVNERLTHGDSHLEEERRLFYVAITRAKKSIIFTGAESYGGVRKKKPSVFLVEAGLEPSPDPDTSIGIQTVRRDARCSTPESLLLSPDSHADREEAEREVFQLKRRFSFTQLAAFRKCPLQYKFAHVYRIPILGTYQKSFGQSIHLALHDILALHVERGKSKQGDLFSQLAAGSLPANTDDTSERCKQAGWQLASGGFRVTRDEVMDMFASRWIDDWYPTQEIRDRYFDEGKDAARRLYEVWSAAPPEVAFLEQSFEWRIGEHSLKGSVDRIDRLPDGRYAILDYKTGEPKVTGELAPEDQEQLWMYQLAMEERGLPIAALSYVYVKTGTQADVPLLQGSAREAFQAELLQRMNEILGSRFRPTPSPFTCKYCDFKNICEFRRL